MSQENNTPKEETHDTFSTIGKDAMNLWKRIEDLARSELQQHHSNPENALKIIKFFGLMSICATLVWIITSPLQKPWFLNFYSFSFFGSLTVIVLGLKNWSTDIKSWWIHFWFVLFLLSNSGLNFITFLLAASLGVHLFKRKSIIFPHVLGLVHAKKN